MSRLFRAGTLRALLILPVLCATSVPAAAQVAPEPGYAKLGGFAGVTFMPKFTFDGETFDGETAYKEIDGEELFFLPRIDEQPLIRFILGYRARHASLEVSYERTQHEGTFMDVPLDATFQAINVDGRFFFAPRSRVQPYVLAGGSFPWFTVEDGGFNGDLDDPEVGDARFKGYGLNTEAGVTIFPTPAFGVSVGYSYRLIWFDRATGVSDTLGHLRPRFRETTGAVAITGTFVF
jgi:opacity protein-like surface antigen